MGFAGATIGYVGDRVGQFEPPNPSGPPPTQGYFPGYAKTDLRAGVKYDLWEGTFFVNNLADKRGLLNGGPGNYIPPYAFVYITPRTVGLSVARRF